MVLVDTSIWIDHFRRPNESLRTLLLEQRILTHPFVIGELAAGNLPNRKLTIGLLDGLPRVIAAENAEVMSFIELQRMFGVGTGFLDLHLLSSCFLSKCQLWTKDKSLAQCAARLGISFPGG